MNPYEMVLGIVVIVMIASIFKARFSGSGRHGEDRAGRNAETAQLVAELQALRERVKVLERIATDRESQLDREIEQLRDR